MGRVEDVLAENGCNCECDHSAQEHDDGCERCLACRVESALRADRAARLRCYCRNRIDLYTPAELAISEAVRAVEAAGCDPLLTEAVNLLAEANENVAHFVLKEQTPTDGTKTGGSNG